MPIRNAIARPLRLAFLMPLMLLAGCGGHHLEPAPTGLAYLCNGAPLTIIYNDGGYIPGSTARDAGGSVPRSRAQLIFHGEQIEMVADDAFTDLRYVGVSSPVIWTAAGETARLTRPTATPSTLDCQRVRSVTPAAPTGAEAPHPAA